MAGDPAPAGAEEVAGTSPALARDLNRRLQRGKVGTKTGGKPSPCGLRPVSLRLVLPNKSCGRELEQRMMLLYG